MQLLLLHCTVRLRQREASDLPALLQRCNGKEGERENTVHRWVVVPFGNFKSPEGTSKVSDGLQFVPLRKVSILGQRNRQQWIQFGEACRLDAEAWTY